jgi:uncharacterized membrane protein (DUF485 family)
MESKKENPKGKFIFIGLIIASFICLTIPIVLDINPLYFVLFVVVYVIFSLILSSIAEKFDNKILNKIVIITAYPLAIIFFILRLGVPTLTIFFNAFFLFITTYGIPFLIMNGIESIFEIGLKRPTMIFLALTLASILSVYLSKYLLILILRVSPVLRGSYEDRPRHKHLQELTTIFYQKNNILFFIYFCYFIYLGTTAFSKIQIGIPIFSNETDLAIQQSFLLFLAFSNMVAKSKDVILAPQAILSIYANIALGKDSDDEQKTMNN